MMLVIQNVQEVMDPENYLSHLRSKILLSVWTLICHNQLLKILTQAMSRRGLRMEDLVSQILFPDVYRQLKNFDRKNLFETKKNQILNKKAGT